MRERMQQMIEYGIPLVGIVYLSTAAFSRNVRKEIGNRDNWTCQYPGCDDGHGQPKSLKNGWYVIAAHIGTHNRKDRRYNDPDNGRIHCVEHEIQFHSELLMKAIEQDNTDQIRFNESALRALNGVNWIKKAKDESAAV